MKMDLPVNTANVIKMEKLIEPDRQLLPSEKMSARLIKGVSVLPSGGTAETADSGNFAGWQLYCPVRGKMELTVFGTPQLEQADLKWICGKSAKAGACKVPKARDQKLTELYELFLPAAEAQKRTASIGFCARVNTNHHEEHTVKWPMGHSSEFAELVESLRVLGGAYRAVFGPATAEEQNACRKQFLHTWRGNPSDADLYLGRPVKGRSLFLLSGTPSVRFRTVLAEALPGAELRYLGSMASSDIAGIWNAPLKNAVVLPEYAARFMMLEPTADKPVVGVETCREPVKPIPAAHDFHKQEGAVAVGRAITTAGIRRIVSIGAVDLKRHYQIIGQTGTGKSTLLANLIVNAIRQGHGLTFFDPHGTTIDVILRTVPEEYADRIRVVRIGDEKNPVPLSMWDSDDPEKESRTISDLTELFADIYDSGDKGTVGPRWERMFGIFAKAAIALLGRRASFESIIVLAQNQENMRKLYDAILDNYPELAESIKSEYGKNKSSDFVDLISWFLCKFQRLTSVEQLQKTLGAGANALDFLHSIDTDTVTLIDLASPVLGTPAARMIGTMILQKLWNAVLCRHNRDRMHMAVLDEAQLFQTNPMPRMLSEGRKFGLSLVLSTQSSFSLTQEIRDALEANSANFSAFRLSPKDAAVAAIRFDDPDMQVSLTRQDAFRAVTSISVNGKQTAPFTLEISRPVFQPDAEEQAARIEAASIEKLVRPYADARALTAAEIQELLDHPEKQSGRKDDPEWLTAWTDKYKAMKRAV